MVQLHAHHGGFGRASVSEPRPCMGPVPLGAVRRPMHVPPARLRLDNAHEMPGARAFVLGITALGLACRRCRKFWRVGAVR